MCVNKNVIEQECYDHVKSMHLQIKKGDCPG